MGRGTGGGGWNADGNECCALGTVQLTSLLCALLLGNKGISSALFLYPLSAVDDYGTRRFFSAPVIANETYIVTIVPPTNNPDFFPANISMGYRDGGGCAGPVTFLVPSSPTAQWIVRDNRPNVVNWR